jgi:cell division control protein 6
MPQQVVIDGRPFDPAFLPGQLVHRESQLRELESYLSPLLKEPPLAAKALIVGPRGSGKTTISRRLVNRYLAENPEAMGFVVNCRIEGSEYNVAMRMLIQSRLASRFIRGVSKEEILISFIESLSEVKDPVLVVLDDADSLLVKGKSYLISSLLRSHEGFEAAASKLGLVMTMRSVVVDSSFDVTVLPTVRLTPYVASELRDILAARARVALSPGSYDDEILSMIADAARTTGDARYAIEVLARACRMAEATGLGRVLPEHVRRGLSILPNFPSQSEMSLLSDLQRDVLMAIINCLQGTDASFVTTGDLESSYRRYCEGLGKEPVAHTRLWETLESIESLGLIKKSVKSFGRRGRTSVVSLLAPASALHQMLTSEITR